MAPPFVTPRRITWHFQTIESPSTSAASVSARNEKKCVRINGIEVPISEFSLSYDLDAEGTQIVNMGIIADEINIS